MPGYVEGTMHEYQHKRPTRIQNTPHKWEIPDYGAKTQCTDNDNDKPILPPEDRKNI